MRSTLRRLGRHHITAVAYTALLFALGGAAALAAPAPASASTYCVGDPEGACDVSKTGTAEGLQQALGEAAASADDDVVRIGAGIYTGNFSYGSASEDVIQGSGAATVIQGVGTLPALSVAGTGSAPTVTGLTIQMATVPVPVTAVGLRIGPGKADGVRVENPGDSRGTAIVLWPGGDVANSTILARTADGIDEEGGASQRSVRDTSIRALLGVRTRTGTWSLQRLDIATRSGGVASYATTSLTNSLVRVSGVDGSPQTSYGILQGDAGLLDVDQVTIHAGPELEYGAQAKSPNAGTATIDITNSIVAGPYVDSTFARFAGPNGTANILAGYSNFQAPSPLWIGAGMGPGTFQQMPGATNNSMEPKFVDPLVTLQSPGVDFRLRHDSPLIDRGVPGGLQGLDLAGEKRLVNGDGDGEPVLDMGAYEYQRRAPEAKIAAPLGGHVAIGTPLAFSAAGTGDPDAGDALTYAWSFGDGTGATGDSASHSYDAAGERTVTLTVTDSTGLTGTASVSLTVDGAQSPTAPGPGPGAAPETGPGPDARDRIAPVLSAASLSTARFRAGRRGTRVRFSLSEAATVRFRVARRAPARRLGGFTRQAPAGAGAVRFRGRLRLGGRLRALPPGRYRLTLVATDAAGNSSSPTRLRFRILR